MLKKIITSILSLMVIVWSVCISHASSNIDIIYDIIDSPSVSSDAGVSIIDSIINGGTIDKPKSSKKVKIVKDYDNLDNKEFKLNVKNRSNNEDDYILGLDLSKHNGRLNWKKIKAKNIEFVILRAGYGTSPNSDIRFKEYIKDAIDNDMIIGIYWFSYAYTNDMAKREAIACYKTIKKYKKHINLPVFYDFEYDSVRYANIKHTHIGKSKASKFANTFCETIESKGYRAGIYTNIDYANRYFTRNVLDKYDTWIAQWTNSCTYNYNYIIWQYADNKNIGGKIFDANRLYYNRYECEVNKND